MHGNYSNLLIQSGMAHSACQEELDEVEAFLHSRLPPQEEKKPEL